MTGDLRRQTTVKGASGGRISVCSRAIHISTSGAERIALSYHCERKKADRTDVVFGQDRAGAIRQTHRTYAWSALAAYGLNGTI